MPRGPRSRASLEAVANTGRVPPAGIVLLSDGIDNATSQRSEAVLRDLGARGIPVFTVPIGLPDPDDVSIRNIVMQEVAFSGDRVAGAGGPAIERLRAPHRPARGQPQRAPGLPAHHPLPGRAPVRGH